MAKRTEVTKVKSNNAVTAELMANFEADAGVGMENMSKDDYAIPRLNIIQSLSPQRKKTDAAYIEGAEEGMIIDSVSNELFAGEDGVIIIPCAYRKAYLEWKPRAIGGGFVADHGSDQSIEQQCKKDINTGALMTSDGNEVIATAEYLCLLVNKDNGEISQISLSMAKTQLKKSRRFNTIISRFRVKKPDGSSFNPSMFYRAYRLTTVPEGNDKGDWFSWNITPYKNTIELENGMDVYKIAKEFRLACVSGDVKVANQQSDLASVEENDSDPM